MENLLRLMVEIIEKEFKLNSIYAIINFKIFKTYYEYEDI